MGRAPRHPFYEVWVALISQHFMVNTIETKTTWVLCRCSDSDLYVLSDSDYHGWKLLEIQILIQVPT